MQKVYDMLVSIPHPIRVAVLLSVQILSTNLNVHACVMAAVIVIAWNNARR